MALELALQYNFVTELTSLIVVADDNFTTSNEGMNGHGANEDVLAGGNYIGLPVGIDLAVGESRLCLHEQKLKKLAAEAMYICKSQSVGSLANELHSTELIASLLFSYVHEDIITV